MPWLDHRKKQIIGWASYDVANSTYATVIATAVYNAYFVRTTGKFIGVDTATLLLGLVTTVSSLIVVVSAPVIGAMADVRMAKKRALFAATVTCVLATASLALVPGEAYLIAMIILIIASVAYGTGEDLIAAFLPEIATRQDMGRVSALGWGAGYIGAIISLGLCLLYVNWSQDNLKIADYAPQLTLFAAAFYGIASIPTFVLLKERQLANRAALDTNLFVTALARLRRTFGYARRYRDLFNFLVALFVFSCGTTMVIQLAAVYAEQTLKFSIEDTLALITLVNLSCAVGAAIFGTLQDRIGSVRTILLTLIIWTSAVIFAFYAREKLDLWLAGNLVGLALGGTGSASRALVARFSPQERTAEFLGLWGVAVKLATAVGPLTFGLATQITGGDYRKALLTSLIFFVFGALLLTFTNEQRGIAAMEEA